MRRYLSSLRATLDAERKAYGFTLVIWGGATMTSSIHGSPSAVEGVAYLGGALVSMGAVILLTLGVAEPPGGEGRSRLSLGAVHLVSVGWHSPQRGCARGLLMRAGSPGWWRAQW